MIDPRPFRELSPVMPEIAEIIISSIERNFQIGGRFGTDNPWGGGSQHWVPSGRAKRQSGKTLVDTGQLAASITYRIDGNRVSVGTNKIYAQIHQYGGTIQHPGGTPYVIIDGAVRFVSNDVENPAGRTKPHPITIPARPYVVIQNDDLTDIEDVIIRYYSSLL